MGIKTIICSLDLAANDPTFAQKYIDEILPASFPRRDVKIAQTFIKETHMVHRFALFQNFYSQTEFTNRIIQRDKHPTETSSNPFKLMVSKYGIMSLDFVKFINSIRNTIHNNGYYFPSDMTSVFTYNFNGKTFTFNYGKPINDVTMQDIFEIIAYVLSENKKLFQNNNDLAKIRFN